MMWDQNLKNKKIVCYPISINREQVVVTPILIPLDYFLSARFCPVKVAKHHYMARPWQDKALQKFIKQAE